MDKQQIKEATRKVFFKLNQINFDRCEISEYNKKYIKEYCVNASFFESLYTQLIVKSMKNNRKPVDEITFIDYGGGCGILSYIASELGIKKVIYNDIYDVSVHDVKRIAPLLKYSTIDCVQGDIDELMEYLNTEKITPDIICSFDVLEHIYNLNYWFSKIKELDNSFSLYFMTSANGDNWYVNRKLKKTHKKAEFIGSEIKKGWKKRDSNVPFLDLRTEMISKKYTKLTKNEINMLAQKTRGLIQEDIFKVVNEYLNTGEISYSIEHPTNTCDPKTGNWAEHIIDVKKLKKKIEDTNTSVTFTSSTYSYSSNKLANIFKWFLNIIIMLLGNKNLRISHMYTLELHSNK